MGLDHGVGHPLLLLCDAKAYRSHNSKYLKGLGDYLLNGFRGLVEILTQYSIYITN